MLSLFEHARSIGPALVDSVGEMERLSSHQPVANREPELTSRAIAEAWQIVIDDVKNGRFDLTIPCLGRLHRVLAESAGTEAPGQFNDTGTAGIEWTATVNALVEACDGFDYSYFGDAVLLAQIRWGGHVRSMAFSLGWLCMNGIHLKKEVWAIYPPRADHDRLMKYLGYAGPDCWDAESLRALIGEYTDSQTPC